jgi:hypothetical protein
MMKAFKISTPVTKTAIWTDFWGPFRHRCVYPTNLNRIYKRSLNVIPIEYEKSNEIMSLPCHFHLTYSMITFDFL